MSQDEKARGVASNLNLKSKNGILQRRNSEISEHPIADFHLITNAGASVSLDLGNSNDFDIGRKSDTQRAEQIAQKIRQHKIANTDNTGNLNIPRRNASSYAIPESREAAKKTILSLPALQFQSLTAAFGFLH